MMARQPDSTQCQFTSRWAKRSQQIGMDSIEPSALLCNTTMNENIAAKQVKKIGLDRLRRGGDAFVLPAEDTPRRHTIESHRSDSVWLHRPYFEIFPFF